LRPRDGAKALEQDRQACLAPAIRR
jgi:hypothetical protein